MDPPGRDSRSLWCLCFVVFLPLCILAPPPSLPVCPTNQVYQSLKLMNGPRARLFLTMRGLSRSAPSSVFGFARFGFFFVFSQSCRKVLPLLFPIPHSSAVCNRAAARRVGVSLQLLHHHYCSCRASASLIMTGQSAAPAKCQKQRLCRHYFKMQKWPRNNFLSGPVGPLFSEAQSETV